MEAKVVAVTGGSGTLGRAVIAELRACGATPVAIDIAGGDVAGAELTLAGIDIADPAAAGNAIATIVERFGRLDGLANVAGGFVWQTTEGGAASEWDRMFRINLATTLAMTRAALPQLKASKGAIVNVGANAATRAAAGMGAYTAAKAGVHKLTESLAEELKGDGVRVNAVLPSIIDSPANRADMPDAAFDRWVSPAALAKTIAFLLSDDASAITGALLPVTGRV